MTWARCISSDKGNLNPASNSGRVWKTWRNEGEASPHQKEKRQREREWPCAHAPFIQQIFSSLKLELLEKLLPGWRFSLTSASLFACIQERLGSEVSDGIFLLFINFIFQSEVIELHRCWSDALFVVMCFLTLNGPVPFLHTLLRALGFCTDFGDVLPCEKHICIQRVST